MLHDEGRTQADDAQGGGGAAHAVGKRHVWVKDGGGIDGDARADWGWCFVLCLVMEALG
jgi:hypothetical protein